jgi:glycosyltransferase involved in cell wall biosynthesis
MIAFGWNGLPQYAARLIAAAEKRVGSEFLIIGSPPDVPITGMEKILNRQIHWINEDSVTSWRNFGLGVPRVYFQPGWAYRGFNSLGEEVKKNGGAVVLMTDNRVSLNARQLLGAAVFRITKKHKFDAWFCPGLSGERLGIMFGMSRHVIWRGLYGADENLFFSGDPEMTRSKQILFVGRFIEKKCCLELAHAFLQSNAPRNGWTLRMIGSGPLRSKIPVGGGISVSDFRQPEDVALEMRQSRILALPSRAENWGMVVHEACLSGCGLLLSNEVGAADDFARDANSVIVRDPTIENLRIGFNSIATWSDQRFRGAEKVSTEIAKSHGTSVFAGQVARIARDLLKNRITNEQ